jgi:hypothetical protein
MGFYRGLVVFGSFVVAGQHGGFFGAEFIASLGTDYRRSMFHQIK